MTPIEAINWLLKRQRRQKYGGEVFLEIAELIRKLNRERAELRKHVDKLEKELNPPPKQRVPFHVEGQGEWSPGDKI